MVEIVQSAYDEIGLDSPPTEHSDHQPHSRAPMPEPPQYDPSEDNLPDLGYEYCVCYEGMYEQLPCRHYVCHRCQSQLRDPCCPMCRADLTTGAAQEQEPERLPRSEWWTCLRCNAAMRDSYTCWTCHHGHCPANRDGRSPRSTSNATTTYPPTKSTSPKLCLYVLQAFED